MYGIPFMARKTNSYFFKTMDFWTKAEFDFRFLVFPSVTICSNSWPSTFLAADFVKAVRSVPSKIGLEACEVLQFSIHIKKSQLWPCARASLTKDKIDFCLNINSAFSNPFSLLRGITGPVSMARASFRTAKLVFS